MTMPMAPPGPPGAAGGDPRAAILARLMGGQGGPPGGGGEPDTDDNGHGLTPLEGVQSVVQDLHKLMELHPDPQAVSIIATCLKAMTALQQQMMSQQQPGGK